MSFNAQAALVEYAPWNAQYPTISGVLLNVQSNGDSTIAMGAHAYRNGVYLPNNGVDTDVGRSGLYQPMRANWSFDFAWNLGSRTSCSMLLEVDTDPDDATPGVRFSLSRIYGPVWGDSWNMEMRFIDAMFGATFDPFTESGTAFTLRMLIADGREVLGQAKKKRSLRSASCCYRCPIRPGACGAPAPALPVPGPASRSMPAPVSGSIRRSGS